MESTIKMDDLNMAIEALDTEITEDIIKANIPSCQNAACDSCSAEDPPYK